MDEDGQSVASKDAPNRFGDKDCVDRTTTSRPDIDIDAFIAGFVAAESCFTGSKTPSKRKFMFTVELGDTDADSCEALRDFFCIGYVRHYPRRKEHYDDEVHYTVGSMRELIDVIIPFMDEHLPPSYKRQQYEVWRGELFDYWENKAKRVRPCIVDGCNEPRRAHGYCRRHLYSRLRM